MRLFLFCLALCLAIIAPAHSRPIHGARAAPLGISQTPLLQNQTVNIGEFTGANQGGVNADYMKAANSPAVVSWTITQTKGSSTYWNNNSGTTLPEFVPFANSSLYTATVSSAGSGCAVGELLTLSNGAIIEVAAISTSVPPGNTIVLNGSTGISRTAAGTQYPTITPSAPKTAAGAVSVVSSSDGGCLSATFTYTYGTVAQTPSPTTAGGVNNLGFTGSSNMLDVDEFTVVAKGADGSTATAKLTYNLIVDAANVSSSIAQPFSAANIFGAGNGSTRPTGLQSFVNACHNCSGSTGDMKLLVSAGSVFSDPSPGPNLDRDDGYQLGLAQLNMGAALTAAGMTPAYTNLLTVEDACRATGTAAPVGNLKQCDGTAGGLTTFEYVTVAGANPPNQCAITSPSSGQTYLDLVGFTIGGSPLYNNTGTGAPEAVIFANTCNVWQEYTYANYNPTIVGGLMTANVAGNSNTVDQFNSGNVNLTINYLTAIGSAQTWSDGGSSAVNSGLSTEGSSVTLNYVYCRQYTQNCFTQQTSTIVMNDYHAVAPFTYPGSGAHVDEYQINNYAPVNTVFTRGDLTQAEGNSVSQGFFLGNYNGSPAGLQFVDGMLVANTETLWKGAGCDSTSRPCAIKNWTAVRQAPAVPATNGANAYILLTFTGAPSDGSMLNIGSGCTPFGACSQPTINHIEFCYTSSDVNCTYGSGYYPILLTNGPSTTAAQAMAAIYNLLGHSTNGSSCDQASSIGLAVYVCVGPIVVGTTFSADLFSTIPATSLVFQTITVTGTGFNVAQSSLYLVSSTNQPVTVGPSLRFDSAGSGEAATCSNSYRYCGQMQIDDIYLQDSGLYYPAGGGSQVDAFTPGTFQSAIGGTTYFNITPNVIFGADNSQYSGTKYRNNLFTLDAPGSAAQDYFNTIPWSTWAAMSPYQVCTTYANHLVPLSGGPLTVAGNGASGLSLTQTVGFETTGGLINDGSGFVPCSDLNAGPAYAVNPYPH
jgi:hypothetical protein